MTTDRGVIIGLSGHPMSGLWALEVSGTLGLNVVYVESGFGGRGDLLQKIQGQEIVYSYDELGLLAAFTPIDQWQGPEITEPVEDHDRPGDDYPRVGEVLP